MIISKIDLNTIDKTRIKYFFNNFIHQIDIIRHKATNN